MYCKFGPFPIFISLFTLFIPFLGITQTSSNMTLEGNWNENTISRNGVFYNDIWGYVDDSNNEYAVIGSPEKIHFIDVTDPTTPTQVAEFVGGSSSVWRDFKRYDRYIYAVADEGGEGLIIFDMSQLPSGNIIKVYQDNSDFTTAHNIYIDVKEGRLYVAGSSGSFNGLIVYDLTANPANPTKLSEPTLAGGYVHDVFVQDNIAYCSSGNDGFYIFDFTNASSPTLLASLPTGAYNHSSWIYDNGNKFIYAEESTGRDLGIIDVSDMNNGNLTILNTFKFPLITSDNNITYHNPFMIGDYAIVSSYMDGVTIFDISDPDNPVRVAHYDTINNSSYSSLDGCWGTYPFLPSGNIIATDIETGLYVLSTSVSLPTTKCGNGVQDDFEEDVDCGGFCEPCGTPPPAPTCDDGIQNQDETAVDCGGTVCNPCPCNGVNMELTLVLDDYPSETTWEVVDDATSAVVASGGSYIGQDFQTVVESFCLPYGCYEFTIFDSYGDGICCGFGNGSYSLEDVDNSTVIASGGDFNSSETTNFCLTAPACPTDETYNGAISSDTYSVSNNITSDGIVEDGSVVIFQAGTDIDLIANFEVESNAEFTAEIVACTPFQTPTSTVLAARLIQKQQELTTAKKNGHYVPQTDFVIYPNKGYAHIYLDKMQEVRLQKNEEILYQDTLPQGFNRLRIPMSILEKGKHAISLHTSDKIIQKDLIIE